MSGTHSPCGLQVSPSAQGGPHCPPQPSSPQARPKQFGTQPASSPPPPPVSPGATPSGRPEPPSAALPPAVSAPAPHGTSGVASDDSHEERDIGRGAIVVRAAERTAPAIVAAIQAGNFYCSSGATIADIGRDGDTLFIDAPGAQGIRAVGFEGRTQACTDKGVWRYDAADVTVGYFRFEVYGAGSAMAWSQPFWMGG